MSSINSRPGVAIVTGAGGQDGYFLTQRLLREGRVVHATARRLELLKFDGLSRAEQSRLHTYQIDLLDPKPLIQLISDIRPEEFYNLAGQSSVSKSFSEPLYTWQTNAETVVHLLECIRTHSPETRFYQASSTEMFGVAAEDTAPYQENSALNPQSPYASAKAAAHLLCRSYREVYELRIACGILANHESHRRPASFLSRKIVEHVLQLSRASSSEIASCPPLKMGNLQARRDWGFAPDYVEGMCRILRQIDSRAHTTGREREIDSGCNYRDYVLATGETHAVWEMVTSAFTIAGFNLEWHLAGENPAAWRADFSGSGKPAVIVDPALLRAAEPLVIQVDPKRARKELGWAPRRGLDVFLNEMISKLSVARSLSEGAGASS